MQRAAGAVAGQLAQVERLLHDAFAGEGGVAVDQHDHARLAAPVADAVLLGPHAAQRHGIDELQVAGIEAQRQMDRAARRGRPVAAVAQVILHVAAAAVQVRDRRPRTRGRSPAGSCR